MPCSQPVIHLVAWQIQKIWNSSVTPNCNLIYRPYVTLSTVMYWQLYWPHFSPGAAHSCLAGPCRRQRASFSCTGKDSHWENGGVDPAELQCLGQASEAVRPGLHSAGAASLFNQGTTLQSHEKGHESTFSPDSCHIYNVLSSYGVDFDRPCTIHVPPQIFMYAAGTQTATTVIGPLVH